MHELSVAFHILDSVKAIAIENNATKIKSVTLQLGEVSGVIELYLRDIWHWAADKEELTKGCALRVETIVAINYCQDCQKSYNAIEHGKICPFCQSENTFITQGNEITIKDIEVI